MFIITGILVLLDIVRPISTVSLKTVWYWSSSCQSLFKDCFKDPKFSLTQQTDTDQWVQQSTLGEVPQQAFVGKMVKYYWRHLCWLLMLGPGGNENIAGLSLP